ncbi:MAG: AAA family ATPase [Deltaproteobacteria bacterium]|jgi:superfamily I DNA/RNA helicase|nr:AAA family ATPase [Deltaproteobacteria bacterium]
MTTFDKFKLTAEQEAILGAKEKLVAITAYAGTGKTSTLRAFAESHPKEKTLYLAFNKSLAEESKIAFSSCPNVLVKTIHSLAYGSIGHKYSRTLGEIRPYALMPYINEYKIHSQEIKYFLAKEVNECLQDFFMSASPSLEAFLKSRKRKIKVKLEGAGKRAKDMTSLVSKVWKDSVDGKFTMPHNGYLKLFQMEPGGKLDQYDRILVDEAQDLNDCMISLVTGARAKQIFVGDPYQQIYGFNGAVNALSKKYLRGSAVYYLTQSFRCPNSVAELANKYLTLLDAPKPFSGVAKPNAEGGVPGNLLIARTNAGLFDFVAKNAQAKRFAYNGGFAGYQFEMILDLVNLINDKRHLVKDAFLKQFPTIEALELYANQANDSAANTRIRIAKKYKEDAFAIYNQMLKNIADESEADYIATTAHKIKGREYKNVILLDDFINLYDMCKMGATIEAILDKTGSLPIEFQCVVNLEEIRLIYMAMTRSKHNLAIPPQYKLTKALIDDFQRLVFRNCLLLMD